VTLFYNATVWVTVNVLVVVKVMISRLEFTDEVFLVNFCTFELVPALFL